ncbi:hypothetical protein CASFOL_006690 [Castilleja foliolosa]|uniref:Uncharacterized protein n=1 Tax=Castilleja foliolosa TaxID=1961234 RepID=A0ABD3E954_9LAMI
MAVSLNSVITFSLTANYQPATTRSKIRVLLLKLPSITSLSDPIKSRKHTHRKTSKFHFLAVGGDNAATETTDKDSKPVDVSNPNNGPRVSELPSESVDSTKTNPDLTPAKPSTDSKRAPLTARERLRAARVLNRYNEPKQSKPGLGSNLLDALRETDKGKKRPGLPEAPVNMLDDSKRGMPKEGWTIEIQGGLDVFLIVFSFVFISTVMFATTYVVWKLGAIHFNEN